MSDGLHCHYCHKSECECDTAPASVIAVTSPEQERRLTARRQSDLSIAEKARRFDALMLDAKFQFEHWGSLCHSIAGTVRSGSHGYYEGRAHTYAKILSFYGDLKQACPCSPCSEKKETIAEACARIAREQMKIYREMSDRRMGR